MSSPTPIASPIASPCRKRCLPDPSGRFCTGCLRTLQEIGQWSQFSPEARARIMAELPARAAARNEQPEPARAKALGASDCTTTMRGKLRPLDGPR